MRENNSCLYVVTQCDYEDFSFGCLGVSDNYNKAMNIIKNDVIFQSNENKVKDYKLESFGDSFIAYFVGHHCSFELHYQIDSIYVE